MKLEITIHEKENHKFALTGVREIDHLNPKEYLLYSTALCAGMTLQSILGKERIKVKSLEIAVSGYIDTDKVEGKSQFVSFNIAYNIECSHIAEQAKVGNAVKLTTEKYCGTLAMLRKIAPVSHEISIVSTEEVTA